MPVPKPDPAAAAAPTALDPKRIIRRAGEQAPESTREFIMSTESADRRGDIVSAAGWELAAFIANPVALWAHQTALGPIGTWRDVAVRNRQLRGTLEFGAPETIHPLLRHLEAAVDARLVRAVSVGFVPVKEEPLDPKNPWGAVKYVGQELVECSLCSVPMNRDTLSVARALDLSDEEIEIYLTAAPRGLTPRQAQVIVFQLGRARPATRRGARP